MPTYFPRHTVQLHLEQPGALRRFSFSLVEMAAVTGIVARTYRMAVLAHDASILFYVATLVVFFAWLLGMLTAHLSNYPLHQWVWRAPAFAGIEVLAEMAASLVFIWLGHEPNGTVRAHLDDWPRMLARTLVFRGAAVILWTLLLAGIVQVVRRTFVHDDDEDQPEVVQL
jgi:hypothetical protein